MKYLLLQASANDWNKAYVDKETLDKLKKAGFKIEDTCLSDDICKKIHGFAINIESLEDLNKLHKTVGDFIFYYVSYIKVEDDIQNIIMIYDDYLE